jgi:Uncharacterised nucleotidyltransferase
MTNSPHKRAVLAAISYRPEFSDLTLLPSLKSLAGTDLLRWLDWSGLALPFFARLQRHNAEEKLSTDWRRALAERAVRNAERTRDMLEEARRLNDVFASFGVSIATLKGFSLSQDFCDNLYLRHQVDFDFLVAPEDVREAASALYSLGYSTAHLNERGETCFHTPLCQIPSPDDDIYALQRQRQVDLHISIWESSSWLAVDTPLDCLQHARLHNTQGLEYLGLSLEDKFLLQVLHAFRHSLRSWMRVSWLLEIARCLEKHKDDEPLWNRVVRRAGPESLTKQIFAFVLGFVEQLFHTPIPASFQSWTAEVTTLSLRAWLEHFAVEWAIADWPGSLNNLFLAAEFIPDRRLRAQYMRSRLFPNKTRVSLGTVAANTPKQFLQLQAARLRYAVSRAALHLKDIAALPQQRMRWKRALGSSRGANFDAKW